MTVYTKKSAEEIIEEIRRDNKSGATELTSKAALALRTLVKSATQVKEFTELFHKTATKLIEAQPSMAPLLNLVNNVCLRLEGLGRMEEVKAVVVKELKKTIAGQKKSSGRVAKNFYGFIDNGCRVATYSHSSTVVEALTYAKKRGKVFQVICSEARPVFEGTATAERLARSGIKTTLVTDAALFDLIKQADILVTGADAVTSQGLVNKVGTCGLAVVAKENKVPFYCLCTEDKFLVERLSRLFRIVEKSPREVSELEIKNVRIRNYYFDSTPFKYVSGIVTDKGILSDLNAFARALKTEKGMRVYSRSFEKQKRAPKIGRR